MSSESLHRLHTTPARASLGETVHAIEPPGKRETADNWSSEGGNVWAAIAFVPGLRFLPHRLEPNSHVSYRHAHDDPWNVRTENQPLSAFPRPSNTADRAGVRGGLTEARGHGPGSHRGGPGARTEQKPRKSPRDGHSVTPAGLRPRRSRRSRPLWGPSCRHARPELPPSAHAARRGPEARPGDGPPSPRTHPEGQARGPARRWCTAPPARSAPPSASPYCRLPLPARGPRLPPATQSSRPAPRPPPGSTSRTAACARSSTSRPKQSKSRVPDLLLL